MAIQHGRDGGVYKAVPSGSTTTLTKIASTTSWTINVTRDHGEIRRHGDNWVTRVDGIRDWNATVDAPLDVASNQTFISARLTGTGSPTLHIALYLTSATLPRWQGRAYVSSLNPTGPAGDLATWSLGLVSDGTLSLLS